MIEKNIIKNSGKDGLHGHDKLGIGDRPTNVPFSNLTDFKNMSEKERYLRLTVEFNKVKQ
jgi:hypothetical protein